MVEVVTIVCLSQQILRSDMVEHTSLAFKLSNQFIVMLNQFHYLEAPVSSQLKAFVGTTSDILQ